MQESDAQLDNIFQALSDSTRRSILMRIRRTEESVSDIANHYKMSLPAVTKHLNVLEQAGLIVRRKDGRKRFCRADPKNLATALAWLEYYQQFWDERLDSLKNFIETNTADNTQGDVQ